MNAPLRHVARSPVLRILACLAWLLLAAVPVHGESMAMPATHTMAGKTNMSMASAPAKDTHATPPSVLSRASECCGDEGHNAAVPGCHCTAMFTTALATVDTLVLQPVLPESARDGTRRIVAPDVAHPPPLRPPAA